MPTAKKTPKHTKPKRSQPKARTKTAKGRTIRPVGRKPAAPPLFLLPVPGDGRSHAERFPGVTPDVPDLVLEVVSGQAAETWLGKSLPPGANCFLKLRNLRTGSYGVFGSLTPLCDMGIRSAGLNVEHRRWLCRLVPGK